MNRSIFRGREVFRLEYCWSKWMLSLALSLCLSPREALGYHLLPTLNPRTYQSASNGFALLVDPSDRSGRGPAGYHLTKDGATVWTNRHSFTLWEAVVSDAGEVAGYGYTHGWSGFSGVRGDRGHGEFLIVVISPQGQVIRQETHAREGSRYFHQPPNPVAEGAHLFNQGKQYAVRVRDPDLNRRVETWWAYDMASGDPAGSFAPSQSQLQEAAQQSRPEKLQPAKALEFPPLQLVAKPPIQLEGDNADPGNPISDIAAFDFDAQGRPVILQPGEEGSWSLLLVSDEGAVLKRLELASRLAPDQIYKKCLAWTGQGRFVVALSEVGGDARVDCFQIDFETETVTHLESVQCPTITALAGFPDGQFAALTSRRGTYSTADGLSIFDAKGGLLSSREQDGSRGEPGELISPEDIAAHGTNLIAVLELTRKEIQLIDLSGRYQRSIRLLETWGRKPNYLSGLASDGAGGFVVYDFNAEQPVVLTDSEGAITSQFAPVLDGGRRFPLRHGVKVSPTGELWTSDARALLLIAGDGKIDKLVGEQPSPEVLREPGQIMIGFDDRMYIADKRTKAVHVFSATGQRLGVCIPDAADLTETSSVGHIAIASDHQIFFPLEFGGERYLHFDAGLQRRGRVESEVDSVSNDWHFQQDGNRLWIAGYNDLFLMENLTNIVRKISRRMDGQWLDIIQPSGSAVARDGSIAVIARSNTGEQTVNVFDHAGEALAMIVLPSSWSYFRQFVYDGRHVFLRTENQVYLYHLDGTPAGRIDLEGLSGYHDHDWDGPFIARHGDELWFIDSRQLVVNRFSLP